MRAPLQTIVEFRIYSILSDFNVKNILNNTESKYPQIFKNNIKNFHFQAKHKKYN